ncbi:MAG: phosphotransferase family protein [Streptosporangiales bacterium]|nr:phosphotransferase family protein [Streptosporangiales bacterium]
MSDTPELTSPDNLAAWMDSAGLAPGAPLKSRYISGGSQNEIYEVTRGDDFRAVLRIPPARANAERDKGIVREYRIIEGLDGTDVPHTEAVGLCEDTSVLGRTFYLMGFVDGWSPMGLQPAPGTSGPRLWPSPFHEDLAARRELSFQLIDGIALLSKVDWKARGLAGLGRPDGFHERQVDRWTAFLERFKGRELPGWADAAAWLRSHRPLDYIPGIMHGDYQFANVMFHHGAPARLAAMVDWEMGTVGDPKLDLAWVVQSWPEDTSGGDGSVGGYVDLTGMPSRSELLERYASVSGRQVDDIDYYNVLARWKLGTVLEQTYQRGGGEKAASFGAISAQLTQSAAELAASTSYAHKG